MEILAILVPLSVVLALLAAGLLVLMARGGQFDDLESPGYAVLADDDRVKAPPVDLHQGDGTETPADWAHDLQKEVPHVRNSPRNRGPG